MVSIMVKIKGILHNFGFIRAHGHWNSHSTGEGKMIKLLFGKVRLDQTYQKSNKCQ